MEVLSKRWALSVVATVSARGRVRYNDLLKLLEGVGPSTLAKRLDELEQARLLVRIVYREAPPRVEYSLSRAGRELASALRPLLRWAASAPD